MPEPIYELARRMFTHEAQQLGGEPDTIDEAWEDPHVQEFWVERAERFAVDWAVLFTRPAPAPAIDAAHIERQIDWSARTFGPGKRTKGLVEHIRKELREIEADPTDLKEWVDVLILGFDGAWRSGHTAQQIIDALKAKQTENEEREWPDWTQFSEDQAIEHVRVPRRLCEEAL